VWRKRGLSLILRHFACTTTRHKSKGFMTCAVQGEAASPGTGGADGVKVIPAVEIMYHLLTPIALAHWIIGDGLWLRLGQVLCTDSFSIIDNVKLINILMVRYQLECTLRGNNRIYIKASSMPRLRSIVLPHMDTSMLYKLGL
jgi:hypothetical protein